MKRKNLPCETCGQLMWPGALTARCRPCRKITPVCNKPTNERYGMTCEGCKLSFTASRKHRRYCSTVCAAKANGIAHQIRPIDDNRVKRSQRETAAPGLSSKRRRNLNQQWQTQGRTCAYCPAKANTVDHVVPLVRGGTNYEGNLTPCCRACNSSKSGSLIVEWRTGRRLPRMIAPVVYNPPVKAIKPKPPKPTHRCPMCFTKTNKLKYCSTECAATAVIVSAYRKAQTRKQLSIQPQTRNKVA